MRFTQRAKSIRLERSGAAGSETGLVAGLLHALRTCREELPTIARGAEISLVDLRRFVKQGKPLSLKDADRLSHYLGLRLELRTKVAPARATALHQKGKTDAQVARALGISRRTVIRYRQRSATR